MDLGYKQIEELLAALHGVEDEFRIALKGRIKHFQRNGWPGDTNTGPGKRAVYDFSKVLKLCLAFEMLQVGMTPDRAIKILSRNWDYICTASSLAIGLLAQNDKARAHDVYLYCNPMSLGLRNPDDDDDAVDATFFYGSGRLLAERIGKGFDQSLRRLSVVNLSRLFEDIFSELESQKAVTLDQFVSAGYQWLDDERESGRERYKEEHGLYPEDDREDMMPDILGSLSDSAKKLFEK